MCDLFLSQPMLPVLSPLLQCHIPFVTGMHRRMLGSYYASQSHALNAHQDCPHPYGCIITGVQRWTVNCWQRNSGMQAGSQIQLRQLRYNHHGTAAIPSQSLKLVSRPVAGTHLQYCVGVVGTDDGEDLELLSGLGPQRLHGRSQRNKELLLHVGI